MSPAEHLRIARVLEQDAAYHRQQAACGVSAPTDKDRAIDRACKAIDEISELNSKNVCAYARVSLSTFHKNYAAELKARGYRCTKRGSLSTWISPITSPSNI